MHVVDTKKRERGWVGVRHLVDVDVPVDVPHEDEGRPPAHGAKHHEKEPRDQRHVAEVERQLQETVHLRPGSGGGGEGLITRDVEDQAGNEYEE